MILHLLKFYLTTHYQVINKNLYFVKLIIINHFAVSDYSTTGKLFDKKQFKSEPFQRTFQYLSRHARNQTPQKYNPGANEGDAKACLDLMLRYAIKALMHFVVNR